jgi:DNA-binding transcriptional ArsR family regulator
MMNNPVTLRVVPNDTHDFAASATQLDRVFFALADPLRRKILERLDGNSFLVSELAAPFDISLQGVSRHIQVLVRAGLVQQERSGRISKCSLEVGPLYEAAIWMNRFSKYWQQQFELLAVTLAEIDERRAAEPQPAPPGKDKSNSKARGTGKRSAPRPK